MMTTERITYTVVTPTEMTFDTTQIIATINRLLADAPETEPFGEIVDLTVVGHEISEPSRLYVLSRVAYRASERIVDVPMIVDAGALRGLEMGTASD